MRKSIKHGKNVGWLIERARHCIRERAFAEKWIDYNRHDWNGVDLLMKLFQRSPENIFGHKRPRLFITARDRFVVATVIQWLGTNVGFSFLQDVLKTIGFELRQIKEFEKRRRNYYNPFDESRDASAWFNINARDNHEPEIAPRIVRRVSRRRHLLRYIPNGFGTKVCVRCGATYRDYDKREMPECKPPVYPVKITKIKNLKRK